MLVWSGGLSLLAADGSHILHSPPQPSAIKSSVKKDTLLLHVLLTSLHGPVSEVQVQHAHARPAVPAHRPRGQVPSSSRWGYARVARREHFDFEQYHMYHPSSSTVFTSSESSNACTAIHSRAALYFDHATLKAPRSSRNSGRCNSPKGCGLLEAESTHTLWEDGSMVGRSCVRTLCCITLSKYHN